MPDTPTFAAPLLTGDFAPWFKGQALDGRADWAFPSAAGAPILLFFMGSAGHPAVAAALATIRAGADLFDDVRGRFFGVTCDPTDVASGRIAQRLPGIRHFLDYDRRISTLYGAASEGDERYRAHILLLDRTLQVVRRFRLDEAGAALDAYVAATRVVGQQDWAPVLTVPNLLEPTLCRALIDLYDRSGGEESGFMREVGGKTTMVTDHNFKRRSDAQIDDPRLRQALVERIRRRLLPAIERTFQFEATRIERYIVAAYDAETGGHFNAHRDNTTKGTAHRRFAVTINLNDDYEGGDLRFPEFGDRTYRAPKGGAIVFSCSLLHEATRMESGRRYATLPFLYDDAGAELRAANTQFLDDGVYRYDPASAAAE
ncbi:MAG: 2OG-Fe(II) oxygenase [Pseudomonadota bacterium]